MTDFDTVEYWSRRFIKEKSFEWLITSEQFIARIVPFLETGRTVLNLGSGSSDLHVHLRKLGAIVTNVDFAEAAVQHGTVLEEKEFGNVETTFLVADATDLPAFPQKFDLVVDKSTADAISCGDGLLNLINSVHASMKSDAVWICCSYSSSRFTEALTTSTLFDITVLDKLPQPKSSPHSPDVWTWIYLLRPSK